MQVSLADAAPLLAELAARAEAGEEVVLTRGDAPPVRLVLAEQESIKERRRRVLERYRGAWKGLPQFEGCTAATLTDDLYDEDGLPA